MKIVRDVLKEKGSTIWTTTPETTVYDALVMMAVRNIGALPVIANDHLVGIFSERDYARKVVLKGRSSRDTTVEELMTSDVLVIDPDQPIDACLKLMTIKRVRHLPVIENHKLIGIVTLGDVGKTMIEDQADTIRVLETYIVGKGPSA
jgi:CBS domain-containing protein